MKCKAQPKRCEDHVHQTEIQDSPRVSIGCPRVGEEEERRQYARGRDRIAQRQVEPVRIATLHRSHRDAPENRPEDPQAGRDERHDAEAGGRFSKEIVRERPRPTACRGLRRGWVGRRPDEFWDRRHSSDQCTVI